MNLPIPSLGTASPGERTGKRPFRQYLPPSLPSLPPFEKLKISLLLQMQQHFRRRRADPILNTLC